MALGPNRVVMMTDEEQVLFDRLEELIDEFMRNTAGTTLRICVEEVLPDAVQQSLARSYTKAGWYNVLYTVRDKTFTFFATQEDKARARD